MLQTMHETLEVYGSGCCGSSYCLRILNRTVIWFFFKAGLFGARWLLRVTTIRSLYASVMRCWWVRVTAISSLMLQRQGAVESDSGCVGDTSGHLLIKKAIVPTHECNLSSEMTRLVEKVRYCRLSVVPSRSSASIYRDHVCFFLIMFIFCSHTLMKEEWTPFRMDTGDHSFCFSTKQ